MFGGTPQCDLVKPLTHPHGLAFPSHLHLMSWKTVHYAMEHLVTCCCQQSAHVTTRIDSNEYGHGSFQQWEPYDWPTPCSGSPNKCVKRSLFENRLGRGTGQRAQTVIV
jgi:hypothetical protein